MRYLVLTDIHANLEALEACIADATPRGFEQTLVLGDLVGYGGDPNAVVERIQGLAPVAIVRGNHDKVACGVEQAEGFNAVARSAAKWTLDVLTPAYREWLAALPEGPIDVDDVVEICHGSPFDEDAYIFDELDAVRAVKVANRPLCLFGHTHYPVTFELSEDAFDNVGSGPPPAESFSFNIATAGTYFVRVTGFSGGKFPVTGTYSIMVAACGLPAAPTPTPTLTVTPGGPTATPTATRTATPPGGGGTGPTEDIPTLSFPMLLLMGLALIASAFVLVRRL